MTYVIVIIGVLIGLLILGFFLILFSEWNNKEPEINRKWTDPKFKDK